MAHPASGLAKIVRAGEALAHWELSPVIIAGFPGMPAPSHDPVGYRFRNGVPGLRPLPCRAAFLNEMAGRPIAPWTGWRTERVHAPAEGGRVLFSDFAYTPEHRRVWCRCVLKVSEPDRYRFRLSTCGGVRIWLNGAECVRFEPFERNVEHSEEISLMFGAGENEILLHAEDLFERDTDWFFEMVSLDERPIENRIVADADPDLVAALARLAGTGRPLHDVTTGNDAFVLRFDEAVAVDVPVTIRVHSTGHDRQTFLLEDRVLKAGETDLHVADAGRVRDGYHLVDMTFSAGDVSVEQTIGAAFLKVGRETDLGPTLEARKKAALSRLSHNGDRLAGKALAMLESGEVDPVSLFDILSWTLDLVEAREDCSDFHMVALLLIWDRHRDALPEGFAGRLRTAILGWRYWVDEPSNDVMWFWSENHTLCFHVCQFIAGRLFSDERFECSGRSGREQQALGEERLGAWLDSIEEHGFIEWNSAAYYPIDFIGLFAIYIFADDPLQARAKGLIDRLFRMFSLHTLAGVSGGSQGRAYDKELRAGPLTELSSFAAVAFGGGYLTSAVLALPYFCVSDYVPPAECAEWAKWANADALQARYTQGVDHNAHIQLFRTDAAMLSTVVDHETGEHGHQQHVLDVLLSGDPMARLWVNHPGEEDPWGEQRPSFWSGNGVLPRLAEDGGVALAIYDLKDARVRFTHLFAPEEHFDRLEARDGWLFAESGNGYAAVWATNGLSPVKTGPTGGVEWRSDGRVNGWVVTVGSKLRDGDFETFVARHLAAETVFDAASRSLSITLAGRQFALSFDGPLTVDGVERPFMASTVEPQVSLVPA
ncbi:UNVERIFIED_ORG: hypothetical protein BCL66_1288 [Martelella mediterranea]